MTTNIESTQGPLVSARSAALRPAGGVVADVMRTVERVHDAARAESIRLVDGAVADYVRQQADNLAAAGL
jgi:hypothetical protein